MASAVRHSLNHPHNLLGATVYTDYRNLQFMSSARLLTPRQLRWMLFFAEFDFVVTFRPGKDNRKADALSRQESTTVPAVQPSTAIIAPNKGGHSDLGGKRCLPPVRIPP
ncbi:hypothetical protein NDU88_003071 [Pleurodeles waltl]|uniref:Reverse transcriptase RNase H-like domain-containing protein n=1 Tax=Pleurodeles waltl TaxID=8319 RepID=A0AAV7WS11_PLEWA|nr:hypothetical protein NDU88_003071 [Pleurodeles waltl]